jgi:hypothetical protein
MMDNGQHCHYWKEKGASWDSIFRLQTWAVNVPVGKKEEFIDIEIHSTNMSSLKGRITM